jgi:hypothetical protein
MRLDIPHDESESVGRRERDISDSGALTVAVPQSPLTRRIEQLQQRAQENRAHYIARPRPERPIEVEHRPIDRTRRKEHRPRRTREGVAVSVHGIRLRSEERTMLSEIGRFRVLAVKDIASTIYAGDERGMRTDVRYLEEHGLVRLDSVAARNDGRWIAPRRIEVVTLTKHGHELAHETGKFGLDQRLYHGLVKPRETEHDTQIYRAYLKEAERISNLGGKPMRVELDFELKQKVQKAIYAARKSEPERDLAEIKHEVAERFELPYVRDKIGIPDARVHYELEQGSRTAFCDVEVATAAYRPRHLQAKVAAGFRVYACSADRGVVAARIENKHHTLDWVLDL